MKCGLACAIALLSLAVYTSVAHAAPYTDDLSKCFVRSTSDDDKVILIRWMFGVISLNPQVSSLVSITPPQRRTFDAGLANLVQRLLFKDCHSEAILALKYEGSDALSSSFKVFGEVAMKEMMNNPEVKAGLGGFVKDVDTKKMTAMFAEAGVDVAH